MALPPMEPSFLGSPIDTTPLTSVVRISGTISIMMRRKNRSPTGLTQASSQSAAASPPMICDRIAPSATPSASPPSTRFHSAVLNHQFMKALSPMAFFQARQPKRRAAGVNQPMRRAVGLVMGT
jgi:hypothetical protein